MANQKNSMNENLTANRLEQLRAWVNVDREFVNEIEKDFERRGLIKIVRIDHHRHQNMLTDAGRSALSQHESGQATATVVSEITTTFQPTELTACEIEMAKAIMIEGLRLIIDHQFACDEITLNGGIDIHYNQNKPRKAKLTLNMAFMYDGEDEE